MKQLQRSLNALFKPARVRAPGSRAMPKAKALAAQHGIVIERDRVGQYWVTHPSLPERDGSFCVGADEVLECTQALAEELTQQGMA